MVALPHMPDRVVRVSEKEGLRIDQVLLVAVQTPPILTS
jgi:homoaconitase/3-isopropylmalate dehydratase large subunit